MTKNCAVIIAETSPESFHLANLALENNAEALEFWLDNFFDSDFSFLKNSVETVATVRGTAEKNFEEIFSAGPTFLDLPFTSEFKNNFPRKKIICSHHDFEKTFDAKKILEIFSELKNFGMPKGAFMVRSANDLLEIFSAAEILRREKDPFILIGMGDAGVVTRLRAETLGSYYNYCALQKSTALGQLTLSDANRLSKNPMVTGIIGFPLTSTASPKMHNAAFQRAELNGYYVKIPCEEKDLPKLRELLAAYKISGINVTIPYKESVKKYLDEITPEAKAAGSVNTILFRGTKLIGFNTDLFGISAALAKVNLEDSRVLVIGAGGAARSAVSYLRSKNAHITITNRTKPRAITLGEKFCAGVKNPEELSGEWDVIINATPLGMIGFENVSPVSSTVFSKNTFVFDMVYEPKVTEFLKAAKKAGVKTAINGETMLLEQAAASFALFTGVEPDVSTMKKALEEF